MAKPLQSDGPFEAIIGLEVHIQLKTKTKLFCDSPNKEAAEPNVHICPICMGHPGSMPQINKEAVDKAVKVALAIGASVLPESQFDRKHYFYPDLPKGFQITQYTTHPLAQGGEITLFDGQVKRVIRFNRMHLEDDAAKLVHDEKGRTLVDYNRAGTPLIELVSEPDIRSAAEAKAFLEELQLIARFVGASDADMEKGQMRCDANISVRPVGDAAMYARTEMKNLNSWRAVERAINYEVDRQVELWKDGMVPQIHETRGWNDAKGETFEQRKKEEASDYRYFPEPDLPPLTFSDAYLERMRVELPELPQARRKRFQDEYELSYYDAKVITGDPLVSEFFERTMSELQAWMQAQNTTHENDAAAWQSNDQKLAKKTVSWLTSNLFGLMKEEGIWMDELKVSPENFAELLKLVWENRLNNQAAMKVLKEMMRTNEDPTDIMQEIGAEQISDSGKIEKVVRRVIEDNATTVGHYKSGKQQAIMYLVGQVMKEMKGQSNPQVVLDLLRKELD